MSRPLTAAEREVVISIADNESEWTVFTDSRRFTRRLLRLCARLKMTPERYGTGWKFPLPIAALRFRVPRKVSEAQREGLRRARMARQKARLGPVGLAATTPSDVQPHEQGSD